VVAVVNKLELERPAVWNFEPASDGLRGLLHDSIALLPFIAFGGVILLMACLAAWLVARALRRSLANQVDSPLLLTVIVRTVGFLVLMFGVYIVLRVSGLTRLALTVLGGTGVLGLVIGIAFRDITENFLASVILSMRRPYLMGDLIEVVGVQGYVQRLTTRATMLVTPEGNHVEIPNSVVYKNTIRNFTTNKNRRDTFTIGIGYDANIPEAQRIVLDVLRDHPAVLADPEPWALVDGLGSAAVNMKVYFWLDGSEHSWLKVRSSVIRLVKRAFQEQGISIPDDAREVIFPRGVPIEITRKREGRQDATGVPRRPRREARPNGAEPIATNAEGGLTSDAEQIEQQAEQARPMEADNLLS
jgi:small-conductance mechanosensitive channel